jgi:tetratricopeptide (TPR) repeat protein
MPIILVMAVLLTSETLYFRGITDYYAGDPVRAEQELSAAQDMNPFSAGAPYMRSFIYGDEYVKTGDKKSLEKAISLLNEAETLDTGNFKYSDAKARLYCTSGDLERGYEFFYMEAALNPLSAQGYYGLADCLGSLMNASEASGDLQKLEELQSLAEEALEKIAAAELRCTKLAYRLKHVPDLEAVKKYLTERCSLKDQE